MTSSYSLVDASEREAAFRREESGKSRMSEAWMHCSLFEPNRGRDVNRETGRKWLMQP